VAARVGCISPSQGRLPNENSKDLLPAGWGGGVGGESRDGSTRPTAGASHAGGGGLHHERRPG